MTQVGFTASGTWVVPTGCTVLTKLLKVAGGGSGGKSARGGGGGGAGGIVEDTNVTVVPGETLTITIGAGGTAPGTALTAGGDGGATSVVGSTSGTLGTSPTGGGGGGGVANVAGRSGGNGGGGSGGTSGAVQAGGAASPAGQGNAGGAGNSNSTINNRTGGGGGGKDAAGAAGVGGNSGGNGGAGHDYSATYGTSVGAAGLFGGGGGGGRTNVVSGHIGAGGAGGGGAGGSDQSGSGSPSPNGTAGTANTGGGGGGSGTTAGGGAGSDGAAGAGGSGAVVLQYTVAAPNVPTSVAASGATGTTIDLGWSAPSGGGTVTSYEVRLNGGSPSTATSPHTFTGLTPGTSYNLEVRAVGPGGTSAWVLVAASTVAAPNVPTAVAAGTITYTTADLSWSAPSGGGTVTSYEVRLNGGSPSTATSPHTFTSLNDGTAYDLEVRAVGPGGTSAWVLVSVTTLVLPEGWYRVDITVGAHTYSADHGDVPDYGVRLPLTLGWSLPDSVEYFPCQADPTRMTFGILVADASELSDVVKGTTVTFAMYTDPDPAADPWQSFAGIVTQLDGTVTDAGNFRVTVYAGDDTLRLDAMVIGYSGDWPQESIGDRIDRIVAEAGLTVDWFFYNGGAEGTLAPRSGTTTVLAAIREALKDVASDNTSEPPDEWYGRYTYSYDPAALEVRIQPFERRVYDDSTLTLDGALVPAFGDWAKLPNKGSTSTWVLVDGVTFGTPSGPPLVRNTNLVDTTPLNPSAQTRDNLGESLLPDGSTQLDGWYTDRIVFTSFVDPTPMGAGLVHAEGLASFAPMRVVVPVVVTPLDPDYELNGVDYLAGTLTGAQLVIPPGGKHRVRLSLRPELLPGTDLP